MATAVDRLGQLLNTVAIQLIKPNVCFLLSHRCNTSASLETVKVLFNLFRSVSLHIRNRVRSHQGFLLNYPRTRVVSLWCLGGKANHFTHTNIAYDSLKLKKCKEKTKRRHVEDSIQIHKNIFCAICKWIYSSYLYYSP